MGLIHAKERPRMSLLYSTLRSGAESGLWRAQKAPEQVPTQGTNPSPVRHPPQPLEIRGQCMVCLRIYLRNSLQSSPALVGFGERSTTELTSPPDPTLTLWECQTGEIANTKEVEVLAGSAAGTEMQQC